MNIRPGNALLLILLIFGGYVMLADFFNLRHARNGDASELAGAALPWPQPWGGYAERELVMAAGAEWMINPSDTSALIADASSRYPLDARQWLDLAQIAIAGDSVQRIDMLLNKALDIRPLHRPTLWSAAQIGLRSGDAELAERQLRQWLRLYPGDTGQALFIGRRWISDPGQLLDRMLPPQREYLEQAMQVALRQRDFALADAVWQRLEPKPELDDSTFLQYVELLLDSGEVRQATELWASQDPGWPPHMLVNGAFTRPLGAGLGLNWRRDAAPPGVVIERDSTRSHSSPASLKIAFNGKENPNLARPWIRIPVTPGGRYRLTGMWRAEGLTTRALPYLQLNAEGARVRETVAVPGNEFDWQPWSVDFDVPDEVQLMRLVLRRDATRAFDRFIGGALWLDDLKLEPIAVSRHPQSLQSAASEALGRQASESGPGSGSRFPVSGDRRGDAAPDSAASSESAGSHGDDPARNALPAADPADHPPTREATTGDGHTLESQAPARSANSRAASESQFNLEFSAGANLGPAFNDQGLATGTGAESDGPARKRKSGNPKPARSAR